MDSSFHIEFRSGRAAVERHGSRPVFQMPWEKGIWRRIFNPHPSPLSTLSRSIPFDPLSPNSPQIQNSSSQIIPNVPNSSSNFQFNSNPLSSSHKGFPSLNSSSSSSLNPPTQSFWSSFFGYSDLQQGRVDGLRHLAISRFISMLASTSGSTLFMSSTDPWDLHDSFSAALSMKATSTIVKRSMDLLRFKNWCDLHDRQFIPFSEAILWQFLRELQHTAKPSGLQSILQAVNFAIHVLGCQHEETPLASVRIKGICAGHKALAMQIKHAEPLSVEQIVHLETLCCSSGDQYLKLLYGSILIALYARSRWKDIQGAHSIDFDPDAFAPQYIELPSQHFKTAAMLAKKLHFLPITAIGFSISGQPWIHHYIQARRHLNLPISGKLSSPFLPTKTDDHLSTEPVTSSQITKLLRELFRDDLVRSHSLKHTCLSFAAKRGLDPHIRKLLGYHLDRSEVTLATYSRDLLAEPLRQLRSLLLEIQAGIFLPDSTRSGYFPPRQFEESAAPNFNQDLDGESFNINSDTEADKDVSEIPNQPDDPNDHDEDPGNLFGDDSSSSYSSSSSSSFVDDEDQVDSVPDFPSDLQDKCFHYVEKFLPVKHKQTHRLHLLAGAEHSRLICGRALSQTYERLDRFPSHPLPTCVQCFASKLVGSFDEC